MKQIKFGISENYISNWGINHAIREIYQNFIDYGEFNININHLSNNLSSVTLSNTYQPTSWEFLKIGISKKNQGSIGGHGEGLKLAGLVFCRNDLKFKIHSSLGSAIPMFYNDDMIGLSYGISIDQDVIDESFKIEFECKTDDIVLFENTYINKNDIIHSSYYGDIVNKNLGDIYVGGLYVCNIKNLKYAFNFKPSFIKLDRDRSVPHTWDLEYYMNRIINSCSEHLEFKSSDIYNREFNVGDIPNKLAKKFKPFFSENGKLHLKSSGTVITDSEKIMKISKNPDVFKKIEKLKYNANFKKRETPSKVLTDLRDRLILNDIDIIKFNSVIKLSRRWKKS